MKTIFKYDLPVDPGPFFIDMPEGAWMLGVGAQHDSPVLWAVVDTEAPKRRRAGYAAWTGRDHGEGGLPANYQGTVSWNGLVVHYFLYARDEPI